MAWRLTQTVSDPRPACLLEYSNGPSASYYTRGESQTVRTWKTIEFTHTVNKGEKQKYTCVEITWPIELVSLIMADKSL